VGAINFKTYDLMVEEGTLDPAKAPIIWVTPDYADYNLTVHPDLEKMFGAGFIDKLQKVLVDCTDKEVLKAFNRDKLIPAKNEDFAGIEAVAKKLDLMR
jgi:phosphonate transport system substrate-binding protein